jgi:hypothetical protein
LRCPHLKFFISYITHYVSELCLHCTVAIIIWPYIIIVFFCCDTSSLQINCCYMSLLPIMSCYASFLVLYCFSSRVCWYLFMCASPLFLLIVASFGDFADFAPPLTSVWRTLLWHFTPFCALLLHVTVILHVFAYTTCY